MKKRVKQIVEDTFDSFPDKFFVHKDTQENDLFHEKTFIGTGLDGEEHRLRYFVVISTKNSFPLSQKQKQIIINKFRNISQFFDSKTEKITFDKEYALIKILVSMNVALGDVIEKTIKLCNENQKFLRFHYFVTNDKKPSKQQIKTYLEEIFE